MENYMIIVAITGASGIQYAIKLLNVLKDMQKEVCLLVSDSAKLVLKSESNVDLDTLKDKSSIYYDFEDITASINSGSCLFEAMIVVPCSMKTLAAIANGYSNNAIIRAADVCLKEHRKLVIVPRETPLRSTHLENMLNISREGGVILPAMPAFYHNPQSVDDMINFVVGKILDVLEIPHSLFDRWK